MGADDKPEDVSYGLVMPFVVCEDQGGPYPAEAFVSGVIYGEISTVFEIGQGIGQARLSLGWYVAPALVPQLDLLAMHHGYRMTAKPWDVAPDEHVFVTFEFVAPGMEQADA